MFTISYDILFDKHLGSLTLTTSVKAHELSLNLTLFLLT